MELTKFLGMKKYKLLAIGLVLVLGMFFRFYKLGQTPRGFYLDEAAMGYNSYSLLKTGKDEFGMAYPIVFRSFTDFKVGLYEYMLLPIYKLFGVSELTTRVLTTFWGIVGVGVLMLVVKKFTQNDSLAIFSGLTLAISPWHIMFSRTSYETCIALTFLLLGVLVVRDTKNRLVTALLASFWAAVSVLTYHSQRLISPLLFLWLFLKFRPRWQWWLAGLLCLVIIYPVLPIMFTPGFLSRINTLSVFKQSESGIGLGFWYFLSLFTSYFSPRYLFHLGDPGKLSSYPDLSVFFIWQFPFWIWGWVKLIKDKNKDFRWLMLGMMLIFPIPAALTRDPFSSIRALPLVVPHSILVAWGLKSFWEKWRKSAIIVITICLVLSCLKLYLSIFKFNDYYRSSYWGYGAKELVQAIEKTDHTLPVVLDNARNEIYIQALFFTKYDPKKYQQDNFEVNSQEYYTNMNRVEEKNIGRINVRRIFWKEDIYKEQYLAGDTLALDEGNIREHCLEVVVEVKNPKGEVVYRLVKTNPEKKKYMVNCGN